VVFFNWRGFLSVHIDATSESEYSDEGLSDSTLTGDRKRVFRALINMADFPVSLFLSDLFLYSFLGFCKVIFKAERPPTSITLLILWGSDLMTLDFTMLAATVYSPTPNVPGK
jgi:hypothetical protein